MDTIITILISLFLTTNGTTMVSEQKRIQHERLIECIATVMPITAETPLRGYEKDICDKSQETGIDYMLVLAIGYVESNLCRNTNFQYNCWSISVHTRKYDGYSDSINDAFELMVRYRERGLETVEEIGKVYCPNVPEYPHQADEWIRKVNNYLIQSSDEHTLKGGGVISDLEALQMFGCRRLAARIHNLRDDGYEIENIGKKYGRYKLSTD